MGIFHAYDIRGIYGEELTVAHARRIGFFLPRLLKAKRVLVGRDARASSPALHQALCEGICMAGADVTCLGLVTTPMVYFFTARLGFDASVCITASHNPACYNGFKISTTDSRPVGYQSGLGQLETWVMDEQTFPTEPHDQPGVLAEFDGRRQYLDFVAPFASAASDTSLAIDTANGMAGLLARDVFGETHEYLFEEIDCSFPNHPPDPSNPDTLQALREAVVGQGRDLGIVFDGDADRVMFIDNEGRFVPPDLILAVLGYHFHLQGEPGLRILQDIRTSRSVANHLEPLGAEMHTWKVGRAFAAIRLRELDGVVGGELAGHYYFRDFAYSDSAMLAAARVVDVLAHEKRNGRSFSELIDQIRQYHGSGEINFALEQKSAAIQAVHDHFVTDEPPNAVYDFDGYRLEFDDWWFVIRLSNTEPLLRLVVEAREPDVLEQRTAQIRSLIEPFLATH
ncbi:MAG: phosphomannomutase/phosphoglucomutase [Burkholderiaceae bacterium]